MAITPTVGPPEAAPPATGTKTPSPASGPPAAGKRVRYINRNQVATSPDPIRTALGRYWLTDPSGKAVYGVGRSSANIPFFVKVGKTETYEKADLCPFVSRVNAVHITANPRFFGPSDRPGASGANPRESFQMFLYGSEGVQIPIEDFTPFWHLTEEEFEVFREDYNISYERSLTGHFITLPGLVDDALKVFAPDQTLNYKCDATFEIMTPFSDLARNHLDLQSNTMFSGLTFSFNYLNEDYEDMASDSSLEEKDLPNIYKTLEHTGPNRFLKTATHRNVCDPGIDHLLEAPTGHRNLLSPAETTAKLGEVSPHAQFFPYHADLQFTTDRSAYFGDILAKRKLEGHLLRRLNEGPSTPCGPLPEERVDEDTWTMGVASQILETDIMSKTIKTRPRPFYDLNLNSIDFCEWLTDADNCFSAGSLITQIPENSDFIGPDVHSKVLADPHEHAGGGLGETVLNPARQYEISLLKLQAAEYVNRNFVGYRRLIQTGVNHSETLAYKVSKWDAETYRLKTDNPDGFYTPLQKFFFANSSESDLIHYIDTQVKYNKRYVYEVNAYQMVLGTSYSYQCTELPPIEPLVEPPVDFAIGPGGVPGAAVGDTGAEGAITPCYNWDRIITLNSVDYVRGILDGTIEADSWTRPWVEIIRIARDSKSGALNRAETEEALRNWLAVPENFEALDNEGIRSSYDVVIRSPSGDIEDIQTPPADPCASGTLRASVYLDPLGGFPTIRIGCYCDLAEDADPCTSLNEPRADQGDNPCPDLPTETIFAYSSPCIKIFEVPYFIFDGKLIEQPPVRPLVDLVPYRGVKDQMLINLSNGMGVESQIPIYINPEEEVAIQERLKTEQSFRQEVDYKSHPFGLPPSGFEIYRMTDPPKNYQEFSGHLHAFASTDSNKQSRQIADSASFIDDMVPNQKYYYTFRTIGAGEISNREQLHALSAEHGAMEIMGHRGFRDEFTLDYSFSNPTPVYEVELVDDDGAIYLLVRTVEFDMLHPPPTSKSMNRLLHVRPTIGQAIAPSEFDGVGFGADTGVWATAYDIEEHSGSPLERAGDFSGTRGETATASPTFNPVYSLGVENKSIWGKTLKVRVTSRETCRKLDLNVKFETNHLKDVGTCPAVVLPPVDTGEGTS